MHRQIIHGKENNVGTVDAASPSRVQIRSFRISERCTRDFVRMLYQFCFELEGACRVIARNKVRYFGEVHLCLS